MAFEAQNGGLENSSSEFEGRHICAKKTIHGTLVQVDGVGVLLLGDSGSGKSDCALESVSRGHKLVADDSVEIFRIEGALHGRAPRPIAGILYVRGLGVLNVRELFGLRSVAGSSEIKLAVHLTGSNETCADEVIGSVTETANFLGIGIPKITLPVDRGRNINLLLETAATMLLKDGIYPGGNATVRERAGRARKKETSSRARPARSLTVAFPPGLETHSAR